MRGEETQVFGALRLLGLSDGTLVLPGTHSKWVQVRAGRIESFATLMTGEELRSRSLARGSNVVIVGDAGLTGRYARALAQCGVGVQCLGAQASWRGLHEIAMRLAA